MRQDEATQRLRLETPRDGANAAIHHQLKEEFVVPQAHLGDVKRHGFIDLHILSWLLLGYAVNMLFVNLLFSRWEKQNTQLEAPKNRQRL